METLTLVRIGRSARLERLLPAALAEFPVTELPAEQIASAAGRRTLFAVAVDTYGPDEAFVRLLRTLQQAAPDVYARWEAGLRQGEC